MVPEDMEKTTWGTFCYKVIPFRLKNAGATYQRAMTTLFHDMIQVYVDLQVKDEEEHLDNLLKLFQKSRTFRLRLNPNKCTFGV